MFTFQYHDWVSCDKEIKKEHPSGMEWPTGLVNAKSVFCFYLKCSPGFQWDKISVHSQRMWSNTLLIYLFKSEYYQQIFFHYSMLKSVVPSLDKIPTVIIEIVLALNWFLIISFPSKRHEGWNIEEHCPIPNLRSDRLEIAGQENESNGFSCVNSEHSLYKEFPLNREKLCKSDDSYKWKYVQTNNKKGRQVVCEVPDFGLWVHPFCSDLNFFSIWTWLLINNLNQK